MEYRHPVQGWRIALPVPNVDDPPEVMFVKGTRMERADVAPPSREDALALVAGRALQRMMEPGAWDLLRSDERELWLARGRTAVEALEAEGAFA